MLKKITKVIVIVVGMSFLFNLIPPEITPRILNILGLIFNLLGAFVLAYISYDFDLIHDKYNQLINKPNVGINPDPIKKHAYTQKEKQDKYTMQCNNKLFIMFGKLFITLGFAFQFFALLRDP